MRRVAAALLITCLFAGHSTAQPVRTSGVSVKPSAAELDAFIERGMTDWRIPGLSVVVVHDGASVYEKGFGVLRLGSASRVDAQTLFGMMSTTKAMTALAVAMPVD